MTIKILPARLANQIAAGEVVERPASVVKELVENSLDSGATRIDVDIEKGGSKLIRVRDNGKGITKEELSLALSRHATSKIDSLDDLEAIMSLGFRGEALASISSVSRLTLTSRTVVQEQAWSAYSEGRDMQVKLQPTAHPIGTTVEVLDLFFNTPARRKFLRTEKTEFTHIDELLKRIALSRFEVTINLRHNGKIVKQYRAAQTKVQEEKRIAAVCGSAFVRNMLNIELEHNGLKLHGWITTPDGARQQSDLQYCYVNGRMMRDKLINHAIRQSYQNTLRPEQFATYVLFIELEPKQVDVNVHPAKHEVRFHQARLVHDFIYQALSDVLAQTAHIEKPHINVAAFNENKLSHMDDEHVGTKGDDSAVVCDSTCGTVEQVSTYTHKINYPKESSLAGKSSQVREVSHVNNWLTDGEGIRGKPPTKKQFGESSPSKKNVDAYAQLLRNPITDTVCRFDALSETEHQADTMPANVFDETIEALGKAICMTDGQYVLMGDNKGVRIVSLVQAERIRIKGQLNVHEGSLKCQPLLVPLSLTLSSSQMLAAEQNMSILIHLGIDIKQRNSSSLMVMGVPQPLRQQNLQQLLPDLLSYAALMAEREQNLHLKELSDWLTNQITQVKSVYTLSEAIHIITDIEQLWQGSLPLDDRTFVCPVDLSTITAAMKL
ncbi:DNA mismatch repair endonuclease MutL [Vibrio pectenicida]|uniref:DNA mismatch repair endonuclease MutL n=1 Tax=Vibrio pectenicida TaxID=62763 RepID=UPI003B9DBF1E